MVKFTQTSLTKIEELLKEAGYKLRYEKGNFKSGSCVIEDNKVVVINKFASLDIKILFLLEAIKTVEIDETTLSEKARLFYHEIKQMELKL
jgi:hypothetical protein